MPQDIGQAALGQRMRLSISSFDQRTTPELAGTMEWIAEFANSMRNGGIPSRKACTRSVVGMIHVNDDRFDTSRMTGTFFGAAS